MPATTTAPGRRLRRPSFGLSAFLLLLALLAALLLALLLAAASSRDGSSSGETSSGGDYYGDSDDDDEYRAMIEEAMEVYKSQSSGLIGGALGIDGTSDDFDISELHFQAEFAVEAIQRELQVLLETVTNLHDSEDDDDDENFFENNGPYVKDEAEGVSEELRSTSYGDMYSKNPLKNDNEGKRPGGKLALEQNNEEDEDIDNDSYGFDNLDRYWDEARREVDREMHEDRAFVAVMDAYDDEDDGRRTWGEVLEELISRYGLEEKNWYRWRYWPMHAWLRCKRVNAHLRRFYTPERWRVMREFYHDFVAADLAEKPLRDGERPRTYQFTLNESFDPPTVPTQTKYGRGLAAARDIKEGELVFKATNNTIVFAHPHTWRKWIWALYNEVDDKTSGGKDFPEYACDAMVWSWIQRFEMDGPRYIVLDLDNGSLLNEGRAGDPNFQPPNVRCGEEGGVCDMSYYALQDIREGDELLCDYRSFALIDDWREISL